MQDLHVVGAKLHKEPMSKRGVALRSTLAVLAAAASVLPGPPARAEERHVVSPSYAYVPGDTRLPVYVPLTIGPGDGLTYVNLDIDWHSVTSVDAPGGVPVFDSSIVGPRGQARVRGVELLPPGSYAFYCTRHELMDGRLIVEQGGS